MANSDPRHEASRLRLVKLPPADQRRRIGVDDYTNPDYVDSEVLVTIVRARYGRATGVLDAAAAAIIKRMNVLIQRYFAINPKWHAIVNSSSETLAEATAYAWQILLEDQKEVSFAEIRFLPWIEARAKDYLIQQLAKKNQNQSLEAMGVEDNDGTKSPYLDTVEGDEDDEPYSVAEREQLQARLKEELYSLETPVRRAVFCRLVWQYEWKQIAEILECSVPTARKYYNMGIEKLTGEM